MRKLTIVLGVVALLSVLVAGVASAATAAAASTYKPTVTAVDSSMIVKAVSGRTIEGKVTFASTLAGKPTGNATQVCGRVHVSAHTETAGHATGGFNPPIDHVVRTTTGKPVDAKDWSKGCSYSLSMLPAGKGLFIDAAYTPVKWDPACTGNLAHVATNQRMSLTLPDSPVKVTMDLTLDFKECGDLH